MAPMSVEGRGKKGSTRLQKLNPKDVYRKSAWELTPDVQLNYLGDIIQHSKPKHFCLIWGNDSNFGSLSLVKEVILLSFSILCFSCANIFCVQVFLHGFALLLDWEKGGGRSANLPLSSSPLQMRWEPTTLIRLQIAFSTLFPNIVFINTEQKQ